MFSLKKTSDFCKMQFHNQLTAFTVSNVLDNKMLLVGTRRRFVIDDGLSMLTLSQ